MNSLQQRIEQFLYREARLLDDRQWEDWLHCYSPTVEYWMPAWGDDDQLTQDPQTEISLIYYPNREGLEDRVYRIKTERSAASTPEPRTTHQISNVELLDETPQRVAVRYNWATFSHRYQKTDVFFGTSRCLIALDGEQPQILRKTIRLNNDYISQVIDIYHI
ncbi:benzoate 1,2-dioxygenase small subunit [Serratia grimesii]|jgi:benzoate/toluate 1,2-dioxygenase beta subunit|uniref:Benzoate 1,2-dioxygenase small subunit n=1 Tax=Serratia grimesii TaxID=82995 RepID=A0A7G2JP35_9GAMM|nr:benzoate 1,2-dioxygenase small subunit [Serratia grimesii]CAI0861501.1 2-halobenzoate 1,2-dioxygenase small subunit [Serratia grimesii]CUW22038.1 2-halobenzoate 1%2C2-dioxygenase small subunit [Serratia grimesii]SMZ57413.1 2-halobenzoate 1,2-dioxygenase small subunit [Serratia grimesii]HCK00157.1 benzoate 1,2-dioxygenase small subunit [Serratia grimesii]